MNKTTALKEDFYVQANLVVGGEEIPSIPCKIYLPERIEGKPRMEFRTQDKLIAPFKCGVRAEIKGFNGRKEVSIESPEVYFEKTTTVHWGPELSETIFIGDPQDLRVIHYIHKPKDSHKTNLVLWISPNNMLSPSIIMTKSYRGAVRSKRIHQFKFVIGQDIRITFDKHFRYKKVDNNSQLQWSFLVACAHIDIPAHEVNILKEKLLPDIDDFLLIASLGSRTRTACLGWQASDGLSATTYYRGNYSFPTGESEPSLNQGLVCKRDFNRFMKRCYLKFLSYSNKDYIRNAIRSVVPGTKGTIEKSFLSMFAGLESLVLDFRKSENLEKILSKTDWTTFKKYLKECIKKCDAIQTDKHKVGRLCEKLPELNRISLRYAFEQFCLKYKIDLSDLWPIYDSSNKLSLSNIRNQLIHGDTLPSELDLWVAHGSLRFSMERILISILGWPVSKTEVNKDFLRQHSMVWKKIPKNKKVD